MILVGASYASAAVAYGLLALLLALSRQSRGQGRWLLEAVIATAVWGVAIVATLIWQDEVPSKVGLSADALRNLSWTLCLLRALPDTGWRGTQRLLSIGAVALGVAGIVLALLDDDRVAMALLGSAIVGCMTVEQIFRNSTAEQKQILRPFLWTVCAILAYDLFVFSNALLVRVIDPNLWAARGLVAAVAVPVLVVAAKRHPDWTQTLFISRQVVFYSTTLTGVGLYLLAMAFAGAIIRQSSGQWGGPVQFGFFVAALIVLGVALSSARLRSTGRMFITKHFYRNRYEYRDEWLRLIRTLSARGEELPLDQRSIMALANIIESPGGQIWLNKGSGTYEPFAAWHDEFPHEEFQAQSALVRFLRDVQWVVDSAEYESDPELYNHVFSDRPSDLPPRSLLIPLFHQHELLGFARLIRPDRLKQLNYEDHDLLKTAGRQVAAFLAHDLAMEQLAETRQFEAYNKLSAFVMHDLKNLLSQQALLVENATKHRHRPEFIDDVIKTVDHGVQRMRRLLRQLERDSVQLREQRVELNALLHETIAGFVRDAKIRIAFTPSHPVWVNAQPDRLASVLGHVIANARDASAEGGAVEIQLGQRDGRALIEVRDHGEGMSEEFIRRRLFKPFDTTKGSSGMGIGVYQARDVIRSLGGEIEVQSRVGSGTLVSILLPIAHSVADRHASGVVG